MVLVYRADASLVIAADGPRFDADLDGATLDLVDARRHTVTLEMNAITRFDRYFTEQVDGFAFWTATCAGPTSWTGTDP